MEVIPVSSGISWVDIPEADLFILCGCPADTMKHLKKRGLIVQRIKDGVFFESGPNAILLSDVSVQKGAFSNLSEFPLLHMMFKQGMAIPGHPNNRGNKPILIGSAAQVRAQSEYFFRGQYGLAYLDEIKKTGVREDFALEFYRIKNEFAFNNILDPGKQMDSRIVENQPVEIKNGVFVERLNVNIYRFTLQEKTVTVNLNLEDNDRYEPAVSLDYHSIKKEYFSVIHTGEGDGWDINKPCMGSIITFQGKFFLIDAGPYILNNLKALGISVNEIDGVFHTHAHDDHFAGLTSLMYTGRKIKYFSTKMVRESVMKKLSCLLGVSQRKCELSFEIVDLKFNQWTNVGGLSVMPFYSPHPVETNVFLFRTPWGGQYKQYMHLADIAGLELLKKMLIDSPGNNPCSVKIYNQIKKLIEMPVDIKKVDIGGGMIHGQVEDFAVDRKSKILLSHSSEKLTFRQKEIGSSASFGMVDVLIPSTQNYFMQSAYRYIKEYFPEAPSYEVQMLLNTEITEINVGDIILKKKEEGHPIHLILSGVVEVIDTDKKSHYTISSGSFVGERSLLSDSGSFSTYRAASYVRLLSIQRAVYLGFLERNYNINTVRKLKDISSFLQNTALFGELLSSMTRQRIARSAVEMEYPEGDYIITEESDSIFLIRTGKVSLYIDGFVIEELKEGDFFGEDNYFYHSSMITPKATASTCLYRISLSPLKNIPIIEWKMLESFERRLTMFGTQSQTS